MSAPGAEPPLRVHPTDPACHVAAAFVRIARDNMADVPLLNPNIAVEAIGFERWRGHWLGVLVTPWCMNLLLVPGRLDGWPAAPRGERVFLTIGAQPLAFLPAYEPEIGAFLACSLLSPMAGHDAASARAVAAAALALLRQAEPPTHPGYASPANAAPVAPASTSRRAWMLGTKRSSPRGP